MMKIELLLRLFWLLLLIFFFFLLLLLLLMLMLMLMLCFAPRLRKGHEGRHAWPCESQIRAGFEECCNS